MSKALWIFSLFLVCALAGIVVAKLNLLSIDKIKEISGRHTTVSVLSEDEFSFPPQKNEGFYDPLIYAKSVLLIDEQSGYPLYEKDSQEPVPIASTTKIMTSLVVLENFSGKLDDVVTITPAMVNIEGCDIQLRPGEKIKVSDLLKGLLIKSGNDTAFALALHLSGSKEEFVKLMNEKAAFLNLKDTQYKDPAGLDDEGRSTARDLAALASYAMKNKQFCETVQIPNTTITSVDGRITHELENSNRMIRQEESLYFPLATGIKTGFTLEAGHCLVSAAEEGGHKIISVILNTNENTITASAKESKKLLEWGFANWAWDASTK